MRIERLSLARYGHFTDQEIDLDGDGTCLHVLLGANEAGKTTALSAIRDLLFGIDRQTPFDFRHGYKDLRIGATLRASDGRRLTVCRRKGRQNTLLDEADDPLDESVLAGFLGGANRAIFTGLFGLTHESLRAGGEDMLASKGDLGRMLFEAGSSLAGAIGVLDQLEREAAALFTPRRSATKPFYVAEDARFAAERKVTELALRFDDWRRNQEECSETEAALEDVRRRSGELQERNARLHRIRRTAPLLSALRAAEAELAGLGVVPALPEDASERLEEARRARAVAQDRMRRAEDDAARVEAELSALIFPQDLLAAEADIQRLYERRAAILDSQGALPELGGRRDDLHARLRRLIADLGCDSAAIDQCLPPTIAIARLRDLISQDSALTDQTADAERLRAAAAGEVTAAEAKLAVAAVPPDLTRLALALDQAQCCGDLEGELVRAEHAVGEAAEEARRALAGLRLWHGDAERLALLAVPEHETVLRYERELGEAQRLALRAREELAAAGEDEERCVRDLGALGDGTDLPTAQAVTAARALRDRGWALIRRVFIDADEISDSELETFAKRPKLAERFERAIRDADALADRRQDDAERLARHEQLAAGLEAARTRRAERGEQVRICDRALAALQDDWRALWQPLGIVVDPPREMDRWLVRREIVLRADDAGRAAARHVQEVRARLARERADLCAALALAGAEPCATTSFAALIEEARIRLDAGRHAEQSRAVLGEKCAGAVAALEQAQARTEALAKRRGKWAAGWREALTLVGLPSGTAAAAGKAALELWDDVRLARNDLNEVERRIGRIQLDYAAFAGDAARLLANVLPDLPATEPLAAGRRAFERLQEARRDALRREDLQARLSAAGDAARAAAADAADAAATIAGFAALAGCSGEDELPAAIDRARRKAELTARVKELTGDILEQADGLRLEEAAAEAEGVNPDQCQRELAELKPAIDELMSETETFSARRQVLQQQGADMATARGAAEAEQARRNALADLEDVSERWLVLKTAAFLLRGGVEQFRREQQGPLLARAEALFADLTLGSFVRFQIDYDEADRPCLLGVRSDGTTCPTSGMSDGTRDQLFLALRLAAIERYLAGAEALPFIADDLFVHFDDARASAGLESLIALGGKTQVLLFTHHRHLAELARKAGGGNRVRVQVLNAPA